MIDFHNHIIPQIDDGAKNIEMGINMARYAHQNGTRCVINTVHLQHPTVKNASFDEIDKRKKDLELELKNNNIDLKIISASEIYFNGNLHELIDIPITTIMSVGINFFISYFFFASSFSITFFSNSESNFLPTIIFLLSNK